MPDPKDGAEGAGRRSRRATNPENSAERENSDEHEPAGEDGRAHDHDSDDRRRREKAFEELYGGLGAARSLDPAFILCQAMALAGCAASQADALMFYNAVANQQKTNILGMSVTAKCVRYMFEVGQADDEGDADILDESLWPPRAGRRARGRDDGEL
jgi:hypothetical protein